MAARGGSATVVVVGGGIAGVACARELAAGGRAVLVRDRGRRLGGRMACRTVNGRAVDAGASYFTARDPAFAAVVADWCDRGLAREWTDTFHLGSPAGLGATKSGPVRYAAAHGLRSLVEDLAAGLTLRSGDEVEEVRPGPRVDGEPAAAVVLAMPDPQALDLLDDDLGAEVAQCAGRDWSPVISLLAGWDRRGWPEFDGVFVADSPVLGWVADDGRRRGDGAPVLVAHSTGAFAAPRLDDPATALLPMLTALRSMLGIDPAPRWAEVRRWSLAHPLAPHDQPFHLGPAGVGLCGDGWGPPRVETAYLSGRALGGALLERLG